MCQDENLFNVKEARQINLFMYVESVIICTMQTPMTQAIKTKCEALAPLLDERTRRRWAAVEARAIGRGGLRWGAEATGLSQVTMRAGLQALDTPGTAVPHGAHPSACVVQVEAARPGVIIPPIFSKPVRP